MVEIEFHCKEDYYFKNGCMVRAFSYKEYEIPMHNHVFYEINIVLAGTGTHCIENGRVKAERGDVFVIPPMVAHAYINTKGLEVYHIVIQKSFFQQNREESRLVPGFCTNRYSLQSGANTINTRNRFYRVWSTYIYITVTKLRLTACVTVYTCPVPLFCAVSGKYAAQLLQFI